METALGEVGVAAAAGEEAGIAISVFIVGSAIDEVW